MAFSGAAPARLRSTAALAFPIQAAADLLLEAMQDPGLQTRYLRDVLPWSLSCEWGQAGQKPT